MKIEIEVDENNKDILTDENGELFIWPWNQETHQKVLDEKLNLLDQIRLYKNAEINDLKNDIQHQKKTIINQKSRISSMSEELREKDDRIVNLVIKNEILNDEIKKLKAFLKSIGKKIEIEMFQHRKFKVIVYKGINSSNDIDYIEKWTIPDNVNINNPLDICYDETVEDFVETFNNDFKIPTLIASEYRKKLVEMTKPLREKIDALDIGKTK